MVASFDVNSLLLLLGKNEESKEFLDFLACFGRASNTYEVMTNRMYDFHQLGIGLSFNLRANVFWMIGIEIDTVPVRKGFVQAYDGTLFGGILRTDSPNDVEGKLQTQPFRVIPAKESTSITARYESGPYEIMLQFASTTGPIQAMSIHLLETARKAANFM